MSGIGSEERGKGISISKHVVQLQGLLGVTSERQHQTMHSVNRRFFCSTTLVPGSVGWNESLLLSSSRLIIGNTLMS